MQVKPIEITSSAKSTTLEKNDGVLINPVCRAEKKNMSTSTAKNLKSVVKRLNTPVKRLNKDFAGITEIVTEIDKRKSQKSYVENKMLMQRSEPITTRDGIQFIVDEGCTFAVCQGEIILILEGILSIVERKLLVEESFAPNGRVNKYNSKAVFKIALTVDGVEYSHEVDVETFDKGEFLASMSMGDVVLEKSSGIRRLFAKYANALRKQKNFGTTIVFKNPGWKQYSSDGRWYYVTTNGIIGNEKAKITVDNGRAFGAANQYCGNCIARDFLSMRDIFLEHKENAIVMQYYMMLALIKGLIREHGINPQFLLAIIGETNAKKTTLASLFFKLYERGSGPDIDFTATMVALEEAASVNADAVTIYDDITPPNSRAAELALQSKVEALTRAFGGNLPRKRSKLFCMMNSEASEYSPVLGQAVITGEVLPVTLKSSRSRILSLHFKGGDCIDDVLSYHQRHLEFLPVFAETFIQFVSENQERILILFSEIFDEERKQNRQHLKIPRFKEVLALFVATAKVFEQYLISTNAFSLVDIRSLIEQDLFAIGSIVASNDDETCQRPDEFLISECILNALCAQKAGYVEKNPFEQIYEEGEILAIYPTMAFKLLETCYKGAGRVFPYTQKELYKFLADKELIKTTVESGKTRHTQKFSAKKCGARRFLIFYREKLAEYAEEQ